MHGTPSPTSQQAARLNRRKFTFSPGPARSCSCSDGLTCVWLAWARALLPPATCNPSTLPGLKCMFMLQVIFMLQVKGNQPRVPLHQSTRCQVPPFSASPSTWAEEEPDGRGVRLWSEEAVLPARSHCRSETGEVSEVTHPELSIPW